MVDLLSSFRKIEPKEVAVIGDFVLDTYILGHVTRISPEAPVPVLHVKEIKDIPGMAGNVALNLASLGAKVTLVGRLGHDPQGEKFINYLQREGIETSGVFQQNGYQTPIKQRMIASSQQLLRVDSEQIIAPDEALENQVLRYLESLADRVKVFAISDYKKGFLTDKILKYVFELGRKKNIPVIVDPKGEDFSKYRGCTLIKPNLIEAYAASSKVKHNSLDEVATDLLAQTEANYLLITKSEQGMSLYQKDLTRVDIPVKTQEVKDVTGAGDTVLAMMTLAMANGLSPELGALLSTLAAGIVIQKLGCSRVTMAQIAQAILLKDYQHKVFGQEHMPALQQILYHEPYYLVGIDKKQIFTPELFSALKALYSSQATAKVVLYIEATQENKNMISLLASLQEVSFILVHSGNMLSMMKELPPVKAYQIKENKLSEVFDSARLLQELLAEKVR